MFVIPDLDIDCPIKTIEILKQKLKLIPASKISENAILPHGVGVYPVDIPVEPISELAAIDYKRAEEEFGFVKIDLLHSVMYEKYSSKEELDMDLQKPIQWDLLKRKEIVETLPHIGKYFSLLQEMPVHSIEELAMFIAIIRPAKKYMQEEVKRRGWDCVKNIIWKKEDTDEYQFKKSHAIGYALMISLGLR